jgi:hypothetical protein
MVKRWRQRRLERREVKENLARLVRILELALAPRSDPR